MTDPFVGLHVHSDHSFIDGYSSVERIVQRAADLGQKAVALTDHSETSGHYSLSKMAKKYDVLPVYGFEGYIVDDTSRVKAEKDKHNSHLCLWAKNQQGLKNLWALSSLAYTQRYYKPLIDFGDLKARGSGLIVSDGCLLADMARLILKEDDDGIRQLISNYWQAVGEENFVMELHTFRFMGENLDERQSTLNAEMRKVNHGKIEIAKQYGIPLIVVNDAHYASKDEWKQHQLVWAMSVGKNADDQMENGQTAAWMMSSEEIVENLAAYGISRDVSEYAISNTAWIGENVEEVSLSDGKLHLPIITDSKESDLREYHARIEEGFQRKIVGRIPEDQHPEYRARIDRENSLIVPREFYSYFLNESNHLKWAKAPRATKEAWLMNVRGSGAGSLVAYLMDITEFDPLVHNLLFERFLNEGRQELPDFDADIPQSIRGEMINRIQEVHGADRVCSIGTLSTLGPKSALKDIAKTLQVPFQDSLAMTKILDKAVALDTGNEAESWDEVLEHVGSDIAPWQRKYPELFSQVESMIGLIRQAGKHAGGVIISDEPFSGILPTRTKAGEEDGIPISQFTMKEIESLGFVKYDWLGVRHLDTLMVAQKLSQGKVDPQWFYGFGPEQYDDPAIWEAVSRGETLGIFQLEADAMTVMTKKYKPQSLKDAAVLVALNRPGVTRTGAADVFIRRRNGKEKITTLHPLLDAVLADSLGIMVFQEQMIQAVSVLAGYSLVDGERVRRMVGKKMQVEMREERPVFIQRCLANPEFVAGCGRKNPEALADEIWTSMEEAGSYLFNRAHSVSYAYMVAWGAWLKHYHYPEYITALMRTDEEQLVRYVRDAKAHGLSILPPDINTSDRKFTLTEDGIRYGLEDVRGVGPAAVQEILAQQPFTSFDDYLSRTTGRNGGKKTVVVNLISIGAFDCFGVERAELLEAFYTLKKVKAYEIPDFTDKTVIMATEEALVGDWVSYNPLEEHRDFIEKNCITAPDELAQAAQGEIVSFAGRIVKTREHAIKSGRMEGKKMCFLSTEYDGKEFEFCAFPDTWRQYRAFVKPGAPVVVKVERGNRGGILKELVRLDLNSMGH